MRLATKQIYFLLKYFDFEYYVFLNKKYLRNCKLNTSLDYQLIQIRKRTYHIKANPCSGNIKSDLVKE